MIPTYNIVVDEDNPNWGITAIQLVPDPIHPFVILNQKTMSDKKQSGYQKLKDQIAELRKDVFKMIAGTEEEKAEVIAKHTVPVPDQELKDQAERV